MMKSIEQMRGLKLSTVVREYFADRQERFQNVGGDSGICEAVSIMLKALIFDFDGLILDTETPEVSVWQSIYREYGFELPVEEWEKTIGGYGLSNFDAAEHLEFLSQGRLDAVSMRVRHRKESEKIVHASSVLPGVMDMITQAKKNDLQVAIGSSATHSWVDEHVKRLGIFEYFDWIICQDDVLAGRTKPNPDIFSTHLGFPCPEWAKPRNRDSMPPTGRASGFSGSPLRVLGPITIRSSLGGRRF